MYMYTEARNVHVSVLIYCLSIITHILLFITNLQMYLEHITPSF